MASILDSVASLATPELVGQIGSLAGIDPKLVATGWKAVGPTVLGALGAKAAAPGGVDAISGLMNMVGADIAGNPLGALTSLAGSGMGSDVVSSLLGGQATSITNSLSRSIGIPGLGDLMKVGAPLVISQIAKMAKEKNLDAKAVAKEIEAEAKDLAKSADPNVKAAMAAFEDAKAQDALKAKVGDKGWTALTVAPAIAASYVAAAGKGGFLSDPMGAAKEAAALAANFDPTKLSAGSVLVDGVANSLQDTITKVAGGKLPWDLSDYDLSDPAQVKAGIQDKLVAAREALAGLPAEEAAAYKKAVVDGATRVAEASKEGGFLGIGGKQVSDAEVTAINNIKRTLGI
jgi:hypothetical protein